MLGMTMMDDDTGGRDSGDSSKAFSDSASSSKIHGSMVREYTPAEWTNEKHSLYLKSMEVLFVNQLHESIGFLGWHSQDESSSSAESSKPAHGDTSTPSGQVLLGAWWRRIKSKRTQLQFKSSAFKCAAITSNRKDEAFCDSRSATSSNNLRRSHPYLFDRNMNSRLKEASDQNFVDEEIKVQKSSNPKSSNMV